MTGEDMAWGQSSGERNDGRFKRGGMKRTTGGVMSLLQDLKGGRGEINVSGSEQRGTLKDKASAEHTDGTFPDRCKSENSICEVAKPPFLMIPPDHR